MIKLQTQVAETPCKVSISYGDKILLLGSCFSDSIGKTMLDYGFDTLVNPFGTLYNPASIREAISRLASGREFTESDCVPMGSGAGKICSFSHHTSFAREDKAAFLENANSVLRSASAFFRDCNKIIITLGTAWCYRYVGPARKWEGQSCEGNGSSCDVKSSRLEGNGSSCDVKSSRLEGNELTYDETGSCREGVTSIDPSNEGKIVSNCLKRDSKEFRRYRLTSAECTAILNDIVSLCDGSEHGKDSRDLLHGRGQNTNDEKISQDLLSNDKNNQDFLRDGSACRKDIIFTVSPIRHLADGAHDNQLSKSTLLLSIDEVINYTPSKEPDTNFSSKNSDNSNLRVHTHCENTENDSLHNYDLEENSRKRPAVETLCENPAAGTFNNDTKGGTLLSNTDEENIIKSAAEETLCENPEEGTFHKTIKGGTLLRNTDEENIIKSAAVETLCENPAEEIQCDYFPAYEIMMDELRDYRFYAEDMVHPSAQAISHIADRFLSRHLVPSDTSLLEARIRAHKRSLHRPNLV